MRDITVLITGAGAPGAPGIISCYKNNNERNMKIIGVDMKKRVPTILQLDAFESIPPAIDPNFIDEIFNIALKHKVDVIQPLVTRELEKLSENFEKFNKYGIKICVSPLDNLKIANDKGKLLTELEKVGIDVPKYKIINDPDEFYDACKELGYPEKIICFKPTKSNGSRGFRIIDDNKDKGDLLFNEKPNSTYMRFEEAYAILKEVKNIPELLIMEYLPGREYSVDMLADNGKIIYCIPRLRLTMNNGISTQCLVEKNEEVISYCNRVVEHLKLHGNIGIQVKYSSDEKPKILEVNPRVQGTIVACAAAGVNLPYYGIKLALGEEIPKVRIKWDIEMIRHWSEVYFDDSGHAFTL